MCRYRINQHLIVLKLYSVSINKNFAPEFVTESLTGSKLDMKYVNIVKSTT